MLSNRGAQEQWERFEQREKEKEIKIGILRKTKEQRDLEGCTFSPSIIKKGNEGDLIDNKKKIDRFLLNQQSFVMRK